MTTETTNRRRWPALVAGLVLVSAVAAFGAFSGGSGPTAALVPSTAPATFAGVPAGSGPATPDIEFTYFDGTTATLDAYRGRPLVVNFWASWCPSCVAEMSAAFRPVQQRLGDEVAFIGFNIQDERSSALRLVDETGVLFDLAEDTFGDLYQELGGLGMPFTVFVSDKGEIIETHNGPVTERQLEALILEHLAG